MDGRETTGNRSLRQKSTGALLRSLVANLLLIIPTRLQVELLSRRPNRGLGPLPTEMGPEEAASPSPQPEEAPAGPVRPPS
jgi:hypothetical protein